MSSFAPSINRQSLLSTKQELNYNSEVSQLHKDDSQLRIEEKIDQCQQDFLQTFRKIVNTWKKENLQKYNQIVSKIDASLRKNISKIFCEQIDLQRQNISQKIFQIGQKIKNIQKDGSLNDKITTQNHDETINMFKTKTKQLFTNKSRSISNDGHPRRKLSKGSYFADAKKVTPTQTKTNFSNTAHTTLGFYQKMENTGSKVKKVKRKEETCFDVLQKCNNSTSPSNFMLSYVNSRQILKNFDQNIGQKKQAISIKDFVQSKITGEKEQINNQSQIIQTDHAVASQSQTYKNLMINFQEKISKKLDDLMVKYAKIQEKLQYNQQPIKKSDKSLQIYVTDEYKSQKLLLKQPPKLQIQKQQPVSIAESFISNQENHDQLIHLPQVPAVSLKKINNNQTVNPHKVKNVQQNQSTKTKHFNQKQSLKKAIKSVDFSNKVIKSKQKVIENFQDSIEEISIIKENPTKSVINEEMNNSKAPFTGHSINFQEQKQRQLEVNIKQQRLDEDRSFFESLISQFYGITQKVLLPITKQLLYVIMSKYQSFCQQNGLTPNQGLACIQVKKLQNIKKEYPELLEKIEKVIDSKCQKAKKDKLLMYFEKFLQVVSSYNQRKNIMTKNIETFDEADLKARIKQLRLQLTKAQ